MLIAKFTISLKTENLLFIMKCTVHCKIYCCYLMHVTNFVAENKLIAFPNEYKLVNSSKVV